VRPGNSRAGIPLSSNPYSLTVSGTTLFFVANDGQHGVELWQSGGQFLNTRMVRDVRPTGVPNQSSNPRNLIDVDGVVFFTANDGTNGDELWRTTGDEITTAALVKNIRPGIPGSLAALTPTSLANVDGTLYFAANDGTNGTELWKSDGTTAGTVIVRNIRPRTGNSLPTRLTAVDGSLYFTANDGTSGEEVWISDGTEAGTRILFDIDTRFLTGSAPTWLTNVNDTLYFAARNRRTGSEVWRSRENELHTIVQPANQSNAESDSVSLTINMLNPDGDPLRYYAVNLPPGLTMNQTTGVISGTIGVHAGRVQPYSVRVSVTDGFEEAEATFPWSVADNTVPTIRNPGPLRNNEGNLLGSFRIDATDPEADPLTFRAEGLPDGLQMGIILNPNYGIFYGTIGPRAAVNGNVGNPADGIYQVTVYASDGFNEVGTSFLWTIGDVTAPVFEDPGPLHNNEGNVLSLWVHASDAEGDSLTYRATGLPPGMNCFTSSTYNSGVLSGLLGPHSAGTYEVTLTADDGHNTSSTTFTWTIGDLNPPVVQNPGTQSHSAGSEVSLQIVADDADDDPLAYSAMGLPPGLSIHSGTGLITGSIEPDAFGDFNVTVVASDGTSSGQASFLWHVAGGGGQLDPSFSGDGMTTTDFRGDDDRAYGTAVQANGKIVVVGMAQSSIDGVQRDFALARYNTDGSLDATFGPGGLDGDGRVTTDRSIADEARAVLMQGDLILVAGFSQSATTDFALLRYKSLGGLDTDFGLAGGIEMLDLGGTDRAVALALQPDGKILIAGNTDAMGTSDFAIVRYDVDGLLDTTFGINGRVVTDIAGGVDTLTSLAVQPDGAIVAVGKAKVGSVEQFAAVRYLANGTLDDTFGAISGSARTGISLIPIGENATASSVAIRSDGQILLAGTSYETASGFNFTLAMLQSDGDLDATFGIGGLVRTDLPGLSEQGRAVAFQSDGKIILAGRSGSGITADFTLVRYEANGLIDSSFASGGILTTDVGGEDELFGIALDGDTLLAVGSSAAPGLRSDFAVARYLL
jgi:uncharacterized delta-60 repeat protein